MPRTWIDGVETLLTEAEWARSAAAFLGCGFRVVVPSGPVRRDALAAARRQAVGIAELFDAALDEVPWQAADASDDAVEILGGWRHRFRGPAGAQTTQLRSLPSPPQSWHRTSAVRLPCAVNGHSPLTGLPMISGFEESQALRRLAPDTVGLWWNTDAHLVSSTAGPLLLSVGGRWHRPPLGGGTVPHFVWERTAERLGADDLAIDDEVVAAASSLCAIDPLGTVTVVDSVAGSAYAPRDGAPTELISAVKAVLRGN